MRKKTVIVYSTHHGNILNIWKKLYTLYSLIWRVHENWCYHLKGRNSIIQSVDQSLNQPFNSSHKNQSYPDSCCVVCNVLNISIHQRTSNSMQVIFGGVCNDVNHSIYPRTTSGTQILGMYSCMQWPLHRWYDVKMLDVWYFTLSSVAVLGWVHYTTAGKFSLFLYCPDRNIAPIAFISIEFFLS